MSQSLHHPEVWAHVVVSTPEIAARTARIAAAAGCAGVMLSAPEGGDELVREAVAAVRRAGLALRVGLCRTDSNALDAAAQAVKLGCDATWARGDFLADESASDHTGIQRMLEACPEHILFTSVHGSDLDDGHPSGQDLARRARRLGAVPVAVGALCDEPPPPNRMRWLRSEEDDVGMAATALAVASGVRPENARDLARHASHLIVDTGRPSPFFNYDDAWLPEIVRESRSRRRFASSAHGALNS